MGNQRTCQGGLGHRVYSRYWRDVCQDWRQIQNTVDALPKSAEKNALWFALVVGWNWNQQLMSGCKMNQDGQLTE